MLGKGAGDRAGARIFQSPVNHRRDLRFDSKRHGKPFLTSEKHPCLSCSCDHCDSVSSYDWHQMMWPGQDPEVMVSGMRDILGIVPANAGRNQTGSVSLELREGSCGVLRALDIQSLAWRNSGPFPCPRACTSGWSRLSQTALLFTS